MAKNTRRRIPRWLKIILGLCVMLMLVACCGVAFVTFWPDVAAQNIDKLRDIIGDEPVAQLESIALSIQDSVQQVAYQLGLMKPAAPWSDTHPVPSPVAMTPIAAGPTAVKPTSTPTRTPTRTHTPSPTRTPTHTPPDTPTPSPTHTPTVTLTPSITRTPTPGPSPTPSLTPTYRVATCTIGVSEKVVYTGAEVTLTATITGDSRDSGSAYVWQVNGGSVSSSSDALTYTFTAPGKYMVDVRVTMQSGQLPACETSLYVREMPTPTSTVTLTPSPTITVEPSETPPPTAVPAWQLAPLTPLGKVAGEGQWSPYLWTPDGQTVVGYRTFLQGDPQRPYSVVAIVAFDLATTRLHFVLGSDEPKPVTPQPGRTGTIPDADLKPGYLLATFNGGFKARHGNYGAMAGGLVALPPIDNLATVGIYSDGHIQIGQWNKDIKDSADLVAWRQNGEMLIHDGQINPDTAVTNVTWGLTIKGGTITWRSAMGLSADGRTLYYAAGAQLDVATLTKVMAQAGAAQAFQLDANNYWVHFAAIRSDGTNLTAEPLLKGMTHVDRYLKPYSRDFFYVTTVTRP